VKSDLNDGQMITSSNAGLTWADIARSLSVLEPANELWRSRPAGLVRAQVDWTGVTLSVRSASDREPTIKWLDLVVPGRVENASYLVLDGPEAASRLSIDFEEVDTTEARFRSNLGIIEGDINFQYGSAPYVARSIPFVACHSVKGGTGRTTTAIAIATELAKRQSGRVLLVDADLEAPGLSYLFRASRPEVLVSLEDLVTLAHAEQDPSSKDTVAWASERLAGHTLGDLIILPLRRDLDELASSVIRSEHLASSDRPYAFADLLERVAISAGCVGVVIDVRAGLVPVAAQLILDPSIARVVVSSLAGQSLEATVALMRFTSRELRRGGAESLPPLLVINRIPLILRELGQDDAILAPALERIVESLLADRDAEAAPDVPVLHDALELNPLFLAKLGEVSDLHVPSRRWEGFSEQLDSSGFSRRLQVTLSPWLDVVFGEKVDVPPPQLVVEAAMPSKEDRRRLLSNYASRLVAAETADAPVENPLVTAPLRALAMESAQVPVVIIEGAKGTGKTLTARYVISRGNLSSLSTGVGLPASKTEAMFLPVLGSIQSSGAFLTEIDDARTSVATSLDNAVTHRVAETRSWLRDQLGKALSEREWVDLWLDAAAWCAGVSVGQAGAGQRLIDELRAKDRKLICVIEGIEELYDSASDPSVQGMLRAVLIDLPLRLRSERGRPLGLMVFARRDSVSAGVSQNLKQFRTQYQQYALTWTEDDVLELAAWVVTQSNAAALWDRSFGDLTQDEKEKRLFPLWGRKLGPDELPGQRRVQEAYTAGWVIAALSDLQGRLVARDLVRFLEKASEVSLAFEDRDAYASRLLEPRALKTAIGPTSHEKVAETEEEIAELGPVFLKFRSHVNAVKAPMDMDAIATLGLDVRDIELLRTHGIVLGDAAPYEVPELFRMGLGLRHAGARHSVLGTRRRARQRLKEQS
jgi:cellulose biosynthesis protein BcsQ